MPGWRPVWRSRSTSILVVAVLATVATGAAGGSGSAQAIPPVLGVSGRIRGRSSPSPLDRHAPAPLVPRPFRVWTCTWSPCRSPPPGPRSPTPAVWPRSSEAGIEVVDRRRLVLVRSVRAEGFPLADGTWTRWRGAAPARSSWLEWGSGWLFFVGSRQAAWTSAATRSGASRLRRRRVELVGTGLVLVDFTPDEREVALALPRTRRPRLQWMRAATGSMSSRPAAGQQSSTFGRSRCPAASCRSRPRSPGLHSSRGQAG